MRRTINGQDRKWYLAEILAAAALTCGLSAGATAKPVAPVVSPVEVQEEVGQRVQQLTHGNKEYVKELEYRIQDTFGVTATCPDEFFSTQARNLDCVQGLQNLEIALTKLSPNAQRLTREIEVKIGDAGDWGGLTYTDQELVVPFHADPTVIAEFIAKEVNLLNNVSFDQVRQENNVMARNIERKYFILVSSAPDLQPIVYHDGLERLNFALATLFVKAKPSPEQAAKLGFDRVILGNEDRGLYQNDGELRINLDATDSPVDMQIRLISQIRPPVKHWYEHLNWNHLGNYTWAQVSEFRQARERARQALEWLDENVPELHVTCNLNNKAHNSIDMSECEQGVTTISRAFKQYHLQNKTVPFQNLIVGSLWISSAVPQRYRNAVLMDHAASEKTVYKLITQK